jgi:primosomal protein N''
LSALHASPPAAGDAVAWLAAHLAAVDHVLAPAAARLRPDDPALEEHAHNAHRVQVQLRLLELASAGGRIRSGTPSPPVVADLARELAEHTRLERRLVAILTEALPAAEMDDLADRYLDAVRGGPTRAHPWGVHRGPLERLTFTFGRIRDHLLDVMDARVVPLPRAPHRPPKPAGRWGQYLLGVASHDTSAGDRGGTRAGTDRAP